jgi:hypothetical protein
MGRSELAFHERANRSFIVVAVLAAIACVGAALSGFWVEGIASGRLINSASAVLGLASLSQLKESGWFDRFVDIYLDEENFPSGPPSHEMRRYYTVDNPEQPLRSAVRIALFHNSKVGGYFAVASLLLALMGAWL